MRYRSALALLAAVLALPCPALAGPREDVGYSNVDSDGPNSGSTRSLVAVGTYPVSHITVSGILLEVLNGTYAREAIIVAISPGARSYILQPFHTSDFTGSIGTTAYTYKLPEPEPSAAGPWTFQFIETLDDGAGPDATWSTVHITLNDGPPAAIDIGQLESGPVSYTVNLAANETRWIKFSLPNPVSGVAFQYLDIDTEGSTLGGSDSVIALYNADGNQVGYDDDDGSGTWSQLSFGGGLRSPVGTSAFYDGRDGNLPAGQYYLGIRSVNGGADLAGWGFYRLTPTTSAGPVKVNIRTNVGAPGFCRADFNKSGTADVADIFSFLTAWFSGCP